MKKINFECSLQISTLLILDAAIVILLCTDNIKYFVHPRLESYIWFAVGAILFIALSFSSRLFKPKRNNNVMECVIVLICIFTCYLVFTSVPGSAPETVKLNKQVKESFPQSRTSNAVVSKTEILNISDDAYLDWYMDASSYPLKYQNKTVRIKGYVVRMEDFNENEFIPARMAMTCCAADLVPVGFICRSIDAAAWKSGSWVYVTAVVKIEYEQHMKKELPILYAINISGTEKPEEEYVYPR